MISDSDTITAISTSMGNSGINIIRISGIDSFSVIEKIFRKGKSAAHFSCDKVSSHTIHYGYIYDGELCIDEVLVSVFVGPASFTAENTIEINCHGGSYVAKRILDVVINNGARLALPGEFSKRAFLNGRIDLTQAEAVMDIISSDNELALSASVKQIKGDTRSFITDLRDKLLSVIAYIEAALDDPEHYSFDDDFYESTANVMNGIINDIRNIIDKSRNGLIIKSGINTVIVGKPNVGKSSLMNYILNDDKAIVTDIPGTTRDVIEYMVNLDNITLNLTDTAGIHNTNDIIENLGIDKSRQYIENADLVLCVFDNSSPHTDEDSDIYDLVKDKTHICIFNKSDLESCDDEFYSELMRSSKYVVLSAKCKTGYDDLISLIKELFYINEIDMNNEICITNIRHVELFKNALTSLDNVISNLNDMVSEDLLTIDMLDAYNYLGEIIGETVDDDVVEKIFKDFCMGK